MGFTKVVEFEIPIIQTYADAPLRILIELIVRDWSSSENLLFVYIGTGHGGPYVNQNELRLWSEHGPKQATVDWSL